MTYEIRLSSKAALLAIVGLFGFSAAAQAEPAYKASDIVAHFAPAKRLGGSRSLCIGTESECAKAIPEQAKPVDGFDLKVNFDYNSDRLTPAARSNLDEFANALKDPNLSASRFRVEGHTDGMGSDAYNLDLSMRRAASVVKYLTAHGVSDERLEAKGFGKQKPLVPDLMSSENRRVETRLRDQ